jgi:hypothetical protein
MIIFSLMLATVTAKWSFYLQQLQYNWLNTLGSGGGEVRPLAKECAGTVKKKKRLRRADILTPT